MKGSREFYFVDRNLQQKGGKGLPWISLQHKIFHFKNEYILFFLGNTLLFLQFAISFFVSSSSGHSSFKRTDIHHHIVKKSSASAVRLSTYFTFPKLL